MSSIGSKNDSLDVEFGQVSIFKFTFLKAIHKPRICFYGETLSRLGRKHFGKSNKVSSSGVDFVNISPVSKRDPRENISSRMNAVLLFVLLS